MDMSMQISAIKANYEAFLHNKLHYGEPSGFSPVWMPDFLFDFQSFLIDWAVRQGRAAIFADCGMGKTPMQLAWAENVVRKTNGNVLVVTPLAVARQTEQEAEKFGIQAKVSRDGTAHQGITITNYERLKHFQSSDFVGLVCDESSILKNFDGKIKAMMTEFMRRLPYRLLCTATAAPNDYIELGTSSEALGGLGYMDMLNRFFKNDESNAGQGRVYGKARTWRFKGHSAVPFWRWVSSWARALRKPSDFGFDDGGFVLPELIEESHLVKALTIADGFLFEMPANGLGEEREEQRRTIRERCEKAASLAAQSDSCVVWCNLNDEGDLLAKLLPSFVQIKGKTAEAELRFREEAFQDFSAGRIAGLITKAKIGAWGMNWQHCAHTVCFPTYSYEQYYQLVRRFWRFGQKRPVKVDIVTTESGHHIQEALQRKARQADEMFSALVAQMNNAIQIQKQDFTQEERLPLWL